MVLQMGDSFSWIETSYYNQSRVTGTMAHGFPCNHQTLSFETPGKDRKSKRKALVIKFLFTKSKLIAKNNKNYKQHIQFVIQIIPNSYEFAECWRQACKGPGIPCLSLK